MNFESQLACLLLGISVKWILILVLCAPCINLFWLFDGRTKTQGWVRLDKLLISSEASFEDEKSTHLTFMLLFNRPWVPSWPKPGMKARKPRTTSSTPRMSKPAAINTRLSDRSDKAIQSSASMNLKQCESCYFAYMFFIKLEPPAEKHRPFPLMKGTPHPTPRLAKALIPVCGENSILWVIQH